MRARALVFLMLLSACASAAMATQVYSVVGWGNNDYGQATTPFGVGGCTAIAAGYSHSLALRADGSIAGWGYNYYGQSTPPSGTGFIAIAAGGNHSLALRADGSIAGWGYNYYGEATPPSGGGFIAIAAGWNHSLALRSDGSIAGWGDNDSGQAMPPSGTGFTAIAAGYSHSLALRADGSIVAWGDNYYGQATPPSGGGFVAIAAGGWHSLALRADGSIVAWGDNTYGQATPPSETGFVAIAAGGYHSLALRADGSIVAWGDNSYGQSTPPSGGGFVAVTAGYYHSLAMRIDSNPPSPNPMTWSVLPHALSLTSITMVATIATDISGFEYYFTCTAGGGHDSGWQDSTTYTDTGLQPGTTYSYTVKARDKSPDRNETASSIVAMATTPIFSSGIVGWGLNDHGQATPPSGTGFVAIAAGYEHGLALRADSSIVGWGYNNYGQATPPSGTGFKAISAGTYYSLALRADGSIVGWGWNGYGQCDVPSGTGFVAIAAGYEHGLALRANGSIVGWGYNSYGAATPPSGTGFTAIAAGEYHGIALRADGSIVGWGDNDYGQATPPSGTGFEAIAAGGYHNLALKTDGTIVGWGANWYGQATPPTGTGFVAIAAGGEYSLALKTDGSIVGWGRNDKGQATPPSGTGYVAIASGSMHSLALRVPPPAKAVRPVPANGTSGQPGGVVTLQWSNGGGATSYDVYLGISPSMSLIASGISATQITIPCDYSRTYYWRIDSRNSRGVTTGDTWSFMTQIGSAQTIAGHIANGAGEAVIGVTLTTSDGLSCGNGIGEYMFPVPYRWSGTVTPSRSGYYFTPASMTYNSVTTGLLEQNYRAEPMPVLNPVVPSSGPVGSVITLGGSNLGASQGRVLFGGTAAVVLQWTSTSITCIVPTGATTGSVIVENSDSMTSNVVAFTVTVADILHVSNFADANLQYGTFQYPFKTITGAMMAAVDGTIIEVDDGIYTGPENRGIDTIGKNITLRSANGPASCIIDCNNLDRGFYIHTGEGAGTVVDGFTIVNGYDGGLDTTIYGGGIACVGGSSTIINCVIRNCSGIVGGIYCESGSPVIRNCVIANNSGFAGGILASSSSCTIESCTITGNTGAADMAGGIMYDYCDNISILNTILWNDWPCELLPWESTAAISYNCISGGYEGEGNILTDPLFTDATDPDPNKRDYHLQAGSPCIDAGDPTSDFSQEPWPNGGRIDIGAYGNTQEATRRDGLALVGYQVISKRRVGRTSYEYELALTLQNQNSFDVTDVQIRLVATTEAVTEVIDDSVTIAGITAGQTVTSTDTFKIVVDRSRLIEPGRLTWELLYYAVGSQHSGQQVMSLSALGLDPIHPAGDISGDNIVDHTDLMLLADQWLSSPGDPSADIAPDGGDGIVNFQDYAVLAGHWMESSR